MSVGTGPRLPPPSAERVTRFPALLVGAAVLLALLIVLTPVLITGGGAAGTFITQAEVTVDHPPSSPNSTFLVQSVGNVRYTAIDFGINDSYPSGAPASALHWDRWTNDSDTIALLYVTAEPSVAIAVTVAYAASGSSTLYYYYGVLAVQYNATAGTVSFTGLSAGISVPSSPIATNSALLPLIVSLEYLGSGAPP